MTSLVHSRDLEIFSGQGCGRATPSETPALRPAPSRPFCGHLHGQQGHSTGSPATISVLKRRLPGHSHFSGHPLHCRTSGIEIDLHNPQLPPESQRTEPRAHYCPSKHRPGRQADMGLKLPFVRREGRGWKMSLSKQVLTGSSVRRSD